MENVNLDARKQAYENPPTVYHMECSSKGNISLVADPMPIVNRQRYAHDPYNRSAVPSGIDSLYEAVDYREEMKDKGISALADCTIKVSGEDSYGVRSLTVTVWGDRDHLQKIKACSSYMLAHPECTDVEAVNVLVALTEVTRIPRSLPNWLIQKNEKKKKVSGSKKTKAKEVEIEDDEDLSEWYDDDAEEYLDDED